MKVITAALSRSLDRQIMDAGMPAAVLMENAGRAAAGVAASLVGSTGPRRAVVLCGAGNNGGDGWVVARYLALWGAVVWVVELAPPKSAEAKGFRVAALPFLGERIVSSAEAGDVIRDADVIVDAILGTGSQGRLRPNVEAIILAANGSAASRLAVDLPTGVDADTGGIETYAFQSDATITFGYPRPGLLLEPGASVCGAVYVDSLGAIWPDPPDCRMSVLAEPRKSDGMLRPASPDFAALACRAREANKGDFGHVGIIAGCRSMCGAPALAAKAAQRTGAGLVTVFAPESAQRVIAAKLDEQMAVPIHEADGGFAPGAWAELEPLAARMNILCAGPGIGRSAGAEELAGCLVRDAPQALVLDADGLNALARNPSWAGVRAARGAPLLLTPHPGEAARLLETDIPAVEGDRVAAVLMLASKYSAAAILKGSRTLIAFEGCVTINMGGNPGMATGGAGDVLTGAAGGIWAQLARRAGSARDCIASAAKLAVLVHAAAGDAAAACIGEIGMTAGDISNALPAALEALKESE